MIKMLRNFLFLSMIISTIEAYNVLFIAPTPDVGQWYYMEEFVRELLNRGHVVTTIASFGARGAHPLLTEIFVPKFNVSEHCELESTTMKSYLKSTENFRSFQKRLRWNVHG
jgi:hypothetical protein